MPQHLQYDIESQASGRRPERTASQLRSGVPAQGVILCGDSLCGNRWLAAGLREISVAAQTLLAMNRLQAMLVSGAVVLLDAGDENKLRVLEVIRSLDAFQLRHLLLLARPTGWTNVMDYFTTGVPAFVRMPATFGELAIRISLRASGVQRSAELQIAGSCVPIHDDMTAGIMRSHCTVRLSEREYLLYKLLVSRINTALSRAGIRAAIWRRAGSDRSNVVDVYGRYLRMKLARVDAGTVIDTVRGFGYTMRASAVATTPSDGGRARRAIASASFATLTRTTSVASLPPLPLLRACDFDCPNTSQLQRTRASLEVFLSGTRLPL